MVEGDGSGGLGLESRFRVKVRRWGNLGISIGVLRIRSKP